MTDTPTSPAYKCSGCGYALLEQQSHCPECGESTDAIPYHPWLHRYAMLLVVITFILVTVGGTVTSRGAGLSVPDWPTSYEYNMFLFPPSMWKGGIFYEHTHRLLGSLVGLMSIGLVAWAWAVDRRHWYQWLTVGLLCLVIIQGLFGGFRVTEMSTVLAVVHGVTGQLVLASMVLIAAASSSIWHRAVRRAGGALKPLRYGCLALLVVLVIQLILGATMRHYQAGLAIPDFPTSYGQVIPPLTDAGIRDAIGEIPYEQDASYYSVGQVAVHFAHRVWALAVLVAAGVALALIGRNVGPHRLTIGPSCGVAGLLLVQVALGVSVIFSGRHPELATAHQAVGALILSLAVLLTIRVYLLNEHDRQAAVTTDNAPLAVKGAVA